MATGSKKADKLQPLGCQCISSIIIRVTAPSMACCQTSTISSPGIKASVNHQAPQRQAEPQYCPDCLALPQSPPPFPM